MPGLVGVLGRRGARRSRGTFAEALLAVPPFGADPRAAAVNLDSAMRGADGVSNHGIAGACGPSKPLDGSGLRRHQWPIAWRSMTYASPFRGTNYGDMA
jgi:hypothetical protein